MSLQGSWKTTLCIPYCSLLGLFWETVSSTVITHPFYFSETGVCMY